MTLAAGTPVGPYTVQSALGAGGMGEVYRATDTKLGRDVALKVISQSFTCDPEREAQLLASLNHPHIASVYGLEQADGAQVLAMELVEGGTLADRLTAGPLPVVEALAVARQIAHALQAAHDKGIIHRDLKPANVALTADGQVKALDFGLAKALEPAAAGNVSLSPTLSLAATQAGMVLGTAAYMSPEQARGKPADSRSDVWAFGCVLYEMLTGKRAFDGEEAATVDGRRPTGHLQDFARPVGAARRRQRRKPGDPRHRRVRLSRVDHPRWGDPRDPAQFSEDLVRCVHDSVSGRRDADARSRHAGLRRRGTIVARRTLAGVCLERFRTERGVVYVRPFPGPDRRLSVSTDGGTQAMWDRTGRAVYYRAGDRMMAVEARPEAELALGEPRLLFERRYAFGAGITIANYDLTPDGQRFVMVKDEATAGRLNVVLNWAEELKRLVPTN